MLNRLLLAHPSHFCRCKLFHLQIHRTTNGILGTDWHLTPHFAVHMCLVSLCYNQVMLRNNRLHKQFLW
jgi:hypothetical protein